MATIYIDNQPYEVRDGLNLLQAILELGINLPYFCWHPAMGSVGACRQCAIKQFRDENDTHGRLVMACMTPVTNNARISVMDPEALEFRAGVIEWMMVNHPHDCPVCDEGGECHLQDMTVMTGHDYRRYSGDKRAFQNQNLGPFLTHEMNRCIQCYRCVRFYRDIADGHDPLGSRVRRRRDGTWSVSGLLRPDEVASATGIPLPEHEDYDTVAGLFLQMSGRMPEPGDQVVVPLPVRLDEHGEAVEEEEAVIVVERLDGLRIDQLRLVSRPVGQGPQR